MLSYYRVLRSVLRLKPWLRKCLARCRHCGIFFLTDRRNAGRRDLGCPFGCRRAHRQKLSTQRSVAYYREPEGRVTKKALNARRPKARPAARPARVVPVPTPRWPPWLLDYVRVAVSLIEARRVSLEDVVAMLERTLRQHRMVRTRRIDQGVAWLHEQPP